jgi:hypothetical protein
MKAPNAREPRAPSKAPAPVAPVSQSEGWAELGYKIAMLARATGK